MDGNDACLRAELERRFNSIVYEYGSLASNPVTGSMYVAGQDSVEDQKKSALRARRAQRRFNLQHPLLAPLPLSPCERDECKKISALHFCVACFSESLCSVNYADDHPPFDRYVAGLLMSDYGPLIAKWWPSEYPKLAAKYPPKPLEGLHRAGHWSPVKRNRE